MNQVPLIATIKTRFDLGYIVLLENGEEAQLDVLEQKGRELEHHVHGKEELLYGEIVYVYVIHRDDFMCTVSQFSPLERKEREELEQKKRIARNKCKIGMELEVEIVKEASWGFLCDASDEFLSGVIKKPTTNLVVGEKVFVIVVGKTNNGEPLFEVKRDLSD